MLTHVSSSIIIDHNGSSWIINGIQGD